MQIGKLIAALERQREKLGDDTDVVLENVERNRKIDPEKDFEVIEMLNDCDESFVRIIAVV